MCTKLAVELLTKSFPCEDTFGVTAGTFTLYYYCILFLIEEFTAGSQYRNFDARYYNN